MKPDPARFAAWEVDQADPNNWFVIPDFGVPVGRKEGGFSYPIQHPLSKDYEFSGHVRRMVAVVRALGAKAFPSLRDLNSAWGRYLEDAPDDGSWWPRAEGTTRQAVLYKLVMGDLEQAHRWYEQAADRPAKESNALDPFGRCAAMLAEWAMESAGLGSSLILDAQLQRRMSAIAKLPRPAARIHDHAELLAKFDRFIRDGDTPREARGKLLATGRYGSQSTIYKVTAKRSSR